MLTAHGCQISPSTYYANRARPVSARARRDLRLLEVIDAVYHHDDLGRRLAGARKVWRLIARQARLGAAATVVVDPDLGPVARCTIERLMRQAGLSPGCAGVSDLLCKRSVLLRGRRWTV